MQTWIMHMDMDAFYASIEQLDHPEWKGKPLVVGIGERAVVSAASYEARKYGIRSAMPVFQAKKLCPHAIFTPVRMARYAEVSRTILRILENFSPLVEQASIDEAFLDASGLEGLFGDVESLGRKIKAAIYENTHLTCSIGIAPVKFLAKIASDLQKPDGITIIYPHEVEAFLARLPLGKIPGMGRKILEKTTSFGVHTAGDVLKYPESFWIRHFGKIGKIMFERCNGIDPRKVEPYTAPKSESAENTFAEDTADPEVLKTWLLRQAERVGASLRKQGYKGRTITLKIKFSDFSTKTHSHTLPDPTHSTRMIYETGVRLLEEMNIEKKLRLIGLGVSGFDGKTESVSLSLPGMEPESKLEKMDEKKEEALEQALDEARKKFGLAAITRGRLIRKK